MRKIISLIILITFLFANTAYPLATLRPPINKDKKRTRKTANAAVYLKIARWINKNIDNKGNTRTIIAELKRGKLIFKYKFEEPAFKYKFEESDDVFEVDFEGGFYSEFEVDFVRGFYSMYEPMDRRFDYKRTMLEIPKDISKLASKVLRKSPNLISEYGIKYLNQSNVDLISSIGEAWGLKFKLDEKITEDIDRCLRSLGKNAPTSMLSKKIITRKLSRLQKEIPETIPIIRERALELLEIDRENFRKGLEPFIGDYIAFRHAIRGIGLEDDTAGFYNLFDEIVAWKETGQHKKDFLDAMDFIEEIPEYDFTLSECSLLKRKLKALRFVDYIMWVKIYWLKKKGVDFRVKCEYTPEGTFHVISHWSKGYKGKEWQEGRLSPYSSLPKQVPERKPIIYSSDITRETIYGGKIKRRRTDREPSATFTIVFPESSSGQYKDVNKTMSGV